MNKYKIIILVLLLVILGLISKDFFFENKSAITDNSVVKEKLESDKKTIPEIVKPSDFLDTNYRGLIIRSIGSTPQSSLHTVNYEKNLKDETLQISTNGMNIDLKSLSISLINAPLNNSKFNVYVGGDTTQVYYDSTSHKFNEEEYIKTFKNHLGVYYHQDGGGDACGAGGNYYIEIPTKDIWIVFPWYIQSTGDNEDGCSLGISEKNIQDEKIRKIQNFLENVSFE